MYLFHNNLSCYPAKCISVLQSEMYQSQIVPLLQFLHFFDDFSTIFFKENILMRSDSELKLELVA